MGVDKQRVVYLTWQVIWMSSTDKNIGVFVCVCVAQ